MLKRCISKVACSIIALLMPAVGLCSDLGTLAGRNPAQPAADSNVAAGPTVVLTYSKETFKSIPLPSFVYFVPLVSRALVDRQISADNNQLVTTVSYKRKIDSKSFEVLCQFRISGKGFLRFTFDPATTIAAHAADVRKGETLSHVPDYITFDGEGFGSIEVRGTVAGPVRTVTRVDMRFNAMGSESPVTLGLYDVRPKDGRYAYENRSGQIVARVNSFTFKRTQAAPTMDMSVASINKPGRTDTLLGDITGAIANLFIPPAKVAKLGNDIMLDFGYALLEQKPAYIFPKAGNLRSDAILVAPAPSESY